MTIWNYGFSEMFNHALDHSKVTYIHVSVKKEAASCQVVISGNGVGIFRKIKQAMGLIDDRHAVLELAKGKFTTGPSRHSGEGSFFSSRMFDDFSIISGNVCFSHLAKEPEDWIIETGSTPGTAVTMELNNNTSRSASSVFKKFTSGGSAGFTKTVVPVRLAQYGDDNLVSRSQARRLITRFERFKTVVLGFKGVKMIGQVFADEVFRVFRQAHPEVELIAWNPTMEVQRIIAHARQSL